MAVNIKNVERFLQEEHTRTYMDDIYFRQAVDNVLQTTNDDEIVKILLNALAQSGTMVASLKANLINSMMTAAPTYIIQKNKNDLGVSI